MKACIVGYGGMGREIEKILLQRGHEIVAIIDPSDPKATANAISAAAVNGAEVAIEFTVPNAAVRNVEELALLRVPIVCGTTGWSEHLQKVKSSVEKSGSALIYGSNFSVGVNVFFRVVEKAAQLIDRAPEYEVSGYEIHHTRKKDAPSGTAKTIMEILLANIRRKTTPKYQKHEQHSAPHEVQFASVRLGDVPGTHVVGFDSPADTIELKHTAKNREGFALGAVLAAEWIVGKRGVFTVADMYNERFR